MAPLLFRRGSGATATDPALGACVGHVYLVYLDVTRRVLHCLNDQARHFQKEGVPFTPAALAQQPLQTLSGEPVTAADLPLVVAWREGRAEEATFVLTREGGAPQHIAWSASPLKDGSGHVVGVLGSLTCLAPEPDWQALAGLAHDLRTPLQSLKLLVAVLDHSPILDFGTREALQRIRSSADRAMAIGLDLLEWCRAPVQRSRGGHPAWFPLEPFLSSLGSEHYVAARHKSLVLTTNFEPIQGWEVYSEPVRLGRLLSNLLVNAIRYTTAGRVEFTAAWQGEPDAEGRRTLNLGIIDSGVGISTQEQESIFQPFERGNAGKDDDSGPLSSGTGSGLGLSVVDRLVQELGVTLEVYSESGHGSAFHLLLPPSMLRPIA